MDLTEWLHQYSVRRYGIDNADLKAMWDVLLPRVYHQADCPTPAYVVQPPTPVNFPVNACGQVAFANHGCGCGNGYGFGYGVA